MSTFAHDRRPRILAAFLTLTLLSAAGAAAARTFAAPHVFEQKGRISNTPYTFDTTMFATYNGGVACVGSNPLGASVSLYLYDNAGSPMRGNNGTDVCNPCTMNLDASHRAETLNVEEQIDAAGGFQGVKLGFGVIVVGGADPDAVQVQGYITNSHTDAFDLSVFGFNPIEVTSAKAGATLPCGRVFTAHNLQVTAGSPGTPYSFDTTMFATYTGGLAGSTYGGGATVDYYLFDEATGDLLSDAIGTPVCNPCSVALDDANRKNAFRLGGALPGGAVISAAVSAVCVVGGDANNVAVQAFVVNAHTSAMDVSMYGPPLQEVTSNIAANVPADLAARLGLRSYPNPFNPRTTFAYTLPQGDRVQVRVFDAQGALVRTVLNDVQSAGDHEVAWDGLGDDGQLMASGVYFGRIESGGVTDVQKVMLVK